MPEILRCRSTWGIPPGAGFETWKSWFPELKKQGYGGLEINLFEVHEDLAVLKKLCEDLGLQIIVQGFSEWPGYVGPRPVGLGPSQHLAFYEQMLQQAKQVNPLKVNVQSGADYWTLDESIEFFNGTLAVDAELGLKGKVCHETHRNRSLFTPYSTAYILKQVPK
ncbi:hypothetical protein QQS21_000236 [Conoideocrella luteorostrata]|uniref:Xylose isomerase-like TIM barrel domain-containing protein n=1 Tax=Conoideocrella luteorostrata TaxID=1105319 RepID=A0AAJ0CZB2_9HYPO|nr:hypothetical protein QQS21_000236 [Conoideocrella luteorostrata]